MRTMRTHLGSSTGNTRGAEGLPEVQESLLEHTPAETPFENEEKFIAPEPARWIFLKRDGPLWKGEDGVWYWDEEFRIAAVKDPIKFKDGYEPEPAYPLLRFSSRLRHRLLCCVDRFDTASLRLRGYFSSRGYRRLGYACATVRNFCTGTSNIFSWIVTQVSPVQIRVARLRAYLTRGFPDR